MAAPGGVEVWPLTVTGWFSLILAIGATVGLVMKLGKDAQKFENMQADINGLKEKARDVELIKGVVLGPLGDNGLNSRVGNLESDVESINLRNSRIDAVVERERGADAVGREDRRSLRRKEDKILRGEDEL